MQTQLAFTYFLALIELELYALFNIALYRYLDLKKSNDKSYWDWGFYSDLIIDYTDPTKAFNNPITFEYGCGPTFID